ncbi:hypothetical protein FIU87_09370 [Bacillus sp. THAF10]|uniref:DNA-processing protein DprA n=1 Tax=Bacillus sp. THAF10 TaxID=2587848 RepID=UPI0012696A6F|nr:DNA-processing protein DprA [Bacillus sp. THAF10]QFT88855.1 hypothetical protein FIU87_09370 [Bacillus sp. THAF10]
MKQVRKRLILLHHCPHISRLLLSNILKLDPTLQFLFTSSPDKLSTSLRISQDKVQKIYRYIIETDVDLLLKKYEQNNIFTTTILDKEYPRLLKEIYDPPFVLYVKGNLALFKTRMIAVVGSRDMTVYGNQSIRKLLPPLIDKQFTIVSGLAKGIDISAHRITLENQGRTIAVLGGGILKLYPKEHHAIADEIGKNHLLVSEYPPYESPKKYYFPERNRIISGLCEGVIVIEAKERSGSLITADQAVEQGREVFAVPGSILSVTSRGPNTLIKQGAKLVLQHEDILEELTPPQY